jgi:hypothetical protein
MWYFYSHFRVLLTTLSRIGYQSEKTQTSEWRNVSRRVMTRSEVRSWRVGTTLHYTATTLLHHTILHHPTALQYTILHHTTPPYTTPLHHTTTPLYTTTIYHATPHHTTLHYTTLHYTTTPHYTTPHYYTTLLHHTTTPHLVAALTHLDRYRFSHDSHSLTHSLQRVGKPQSGVVMK